MISIIYNPRALAKPDYYKNFSKSIDHFISTSNIPLNITNSGKTKETLIYFLLQLNWIEKNVETYKLSNLSSRAWRYSFRASLSNFFLTALIIRHSRSKYAGVKAVNFGGDFPFLKDLRTLLKDTTCPKFECPPGYKQHYGTLLKSQTIYEFGYGWTCKLCQVNTYKNEFGNKSCSACPMYTFSTHNRTACYDPYTVIHLDNNYMNGLRGCMFAGSFLSVTSFLFLAIFWKFKNTPLGKSMDIKLVFTQLTSIICNNLLIASSFYITPTQTFCTVRSIGISTFHVIIVAILLVKIQKLLKIFTNKVRVEKHEVTITEMYQFSLILLIILINAAIFTVLYHLEKPDVVDKRYQQTLQVLRCCNTDFHLNIGIVFSIFLYIVCFVQAYRGRHMPSFLYQPLMLVYVSFVSILTLSIMFPIHFFQKHSNGKLVTHWAILTVHYTMLLILMYSKKAYRMVFKPEFNKSERLREQTFEAMQQISMKKLHKSTKQS